MKRKLSDYLTPEEGQGSGMHIMTSDGKKIYHIDCGDLPPEKAAKYLNEVKKQLKQKRKFRDGKKDFGIRRRRHR